MNKILLLFALAFAAVYNGNAQSRLVLNGATMTMSNDVYLVVDNPAANAITRNSGFIISEAENNRLKWNIGTTTGTYTVPWGYGTTNYLPVTFTKTAGAGNGSFVFSTYHTNWKNSAKLPSGITSFNGPTGDNSAYVLDRFWQVNAVGYTTKPDLSNLVLTYLDAEYSATGNTITETSLKAQRWNSTANKWDDMAASGTVNTAAKTVTVSSITASNLYPWWVLIDQASVLPLNFLSFEAKDLNGVVSLSWSTSGEINVSRFIVERSTDGQHFQSIATVMANGISGVNVYKSEDRSPAPGTNFYRVREIDQDGKFTVSVIRNLSISGNTFVSLYPNPSIDYKVHLDLKKLPADEYMISVHDASGSTVYATRSQQGQQLVNLDLSGRVRKGIYMITLSSKLTAAQFELVCL